MTLIVEFNGFYTYPWQNRLVEAQKFIEWHGYKMGEAIAVGDNDLRLDVILPPGVDELAAREKLMETNLSPCTLFFQTPAKDVVTPPAPPEFPWYTKLAIGTRLKILRAVGLEIYTDSALSATWTRGRLAAGNESMVVAALYNAAMDLTPPVGVLCVLRPAQAFPAGLWIAAMGNDGQPNVEAVV